MSDTPAVTDRLPDGMPDAADLIEELRAVGPDARPAIVARYPVLDLLAPVPVIAQWLGMKEQSIYSARSEGRWPEADDTAFGRKVWRFSTAVLAHASSRRGQHLTAEARAARAEAGAR